MQWGSAASRNPHTEAATREAADGALRVLGDASVELVFVFLSRQHVPGAAAIARGIAERFPNAVTLGCSGQSCIGGAVEVETGPSLSLTLAHLPNVSLHPFRAVPAAVLQAGEDPTAWSRIAPVPSDDVPAFVLLGDPFTGDTEKVIRGLELAHPGAVQIGGLASGATEPGGNVLLLGDRVLTEGYIGLGLTGDVAVDTVVAQGCRPIGEPMFVTRSDQNVILEVDGRPPMEVLNELVSRADERERYLFQTSLFIGVQMNPFRMELGRGDFLVRNILGGDSDSGALAIGAPVEERQVVQFQLRDGETAAEDLALGLSRYTAEHSGAVGALLFSCLGRGQGMYGRPNHDSDLLRQYLGDVSVSGFFCNGEIGPVEGRTFLHGYTSAFGIFRPAS